METKHVPVETDEVEDGKDALLPRCEGFVILMPEERVRSIKTGFDLVKRQYTVLRNV
jgi:hypothetical protein